jgi:hypothetical protein
MTDQQRALEDALAHPESPIDEYVLIFHPECAGIIIGAGEFYCDECKKRFSVEELRGFTSPTSTSLEVTCTKELLVFNAAASKILRHTKLVIFLLDEENDIAGVGRGREGDSNSYPLTFNESKSECSVSAGLFLATTGLWDSGTHQCRRGQGVVLLEWDIPR